MVQTLVKLEKVYEKKRARILQVAPTAKIKVKLCISARHVFQKEELEAVVAQSIDSRSFCARNLNRNPLAIFL